MVTVDTDDVDLADLDGLMSRMESPVPSGRVDGEEAAVWASVVARARAANRGRIVMITTGVVALLAGGVGVVSGLSATRPTRPARLQVMTPPRLQAVPWLDQPADANHAYPVPTTTTTVA